MAHDQPVRVLLIEDDPDDADYFVEALANKENGGIQMECAQDLREAFQRMAGDQFDIIVADLSLPDSQGIETFRKIRERSKDQPILVLTGLNDEMAALETLRRGAQDYLVKGQFSGAFLAKSLRYAIERNKIHQDLAKTSQELGLANLKLDHLAHNDPLTDLLNRRGLDQVLSREVAWAHRHGSSIMALLVDLDDFKRINDTLGHAAGDIVLKEIARRMSEPLRLTDFLARIGGDEFLILLPDTEAVEGIRIAEKVRKAISEKLIDVRSKSIRVTASVGVVPISGDSVSLDGLLSDTHLALYRSKKKGKDQVSYDQKGTFCFPGSSFNRITDLKEEGRFHALVHPLFDLVEDQIVGYEFLARSTVPSLENPEDFFRISLGTDSLTSIDERCLSACLQLSRSIPSRFRRHINIAPSTIVELSVPKLVDTFFKGSSAEKYCLEINQRQIIGDPSYLLQPITALKKAGFLIAIENVSFGQNSLEALVLLEPDYLKIDRREVAGIHQDEARRRSLNRLLKMSKSLGMEVIAQGIESLDDLEALKSLGVKFGQGFLWGQPAAALNDPALTKP